jgi:hypothetical protein
VDTKEEWLGGVRIRLQRVAATQNLAPVLEPDAITKARALASLLPARGDYQARFLLSQLHWYRYHALPADDGKDLPELFAAVEMFLPCHAVRMTGLPEQLLPVLTGQRQAVAVAREMLKRTLETSDQSLLVATVTLWQRIVSASSPGDPDRTGHLANLGTAQLAVFRRTGDPRRAGC